MNEDEVWQQALTRVFSTYATDGAGIQEEKLLKHTVKTAGKMGLPGTKHARTKQFHDYMAAARERKEYVISGDVVFRNPAAKAEADAPTATPTALATPSAAAAPAAPPAGTFAQMLQPVVGEGAVAPAAPAATYAAPGDAAGAAATAPDVAGAAGAAALAKAADGLAASKRQTLNDIAAIATRQLTEDQGPPPAEPPAAVPAALSPVLASVPAPVEAAPVQAAAQAPPAMPADAAPMPMEGVMPAVTMGMPPGAEMSTAPMAAPAGMGAEGPGSSKKRGRPKQEGSWASDRQRTNVKRGKFSKKEKDTIRSAVGDYAAANGHSQEDLGWLFKSRTTPGVYSAASGGAWQQIARSLPDRTTQQVWACGTRILHPNNYKGPWKTEEDDQLRELVEQKGNKWLEIGEMMGRMGEACRDRWRTIGLGTARKIGPWDDEEAAALTREVQKYMDFKQGTRAARATGPGQPEDKRMVLDDIDWGAIAKKIGTRNHAQCMERWYKCQAPSMLERGMWGKGDDNKMLETMLAANVQQEWELDFASLVPGRTADQARRRWQLMLKELDKVHDLEYPQRLAKLVQKTLPGLYNLAMTQADAAAADITAVAAPQQQLPPLQQLPPMQQQQQTQQQPQPATDVAAAVFTGAVPSAPGDVQLTIPPVDPLAPGDMLVPMPEA